MNCIFAQTLCVQSKYTNNLDIKLWIFKANVIRKKSWQALLVSFSFEHSRENLDKKQAKLILFISAQPAPPDLLRLCTETLSTASDGVLGEPCRVWSLLPMCGWKEQSQKVQDNFRCRSVLTFSTWGWGPGWSRPSSSSGAASVLPSSRKLCSFGPARGSSSEGGPSGNSWLWNLGASSQSVTKQSVECDMGRMFHKYYAGTVEKPL